jgi:ABC-type glycerol-3-phosphate transport system permease component
MLGLAAAAGLPSLLFFVWPPPQLTLLGFFFVALCGLVPAMLLWQVPQSRPPGGDGRRPEGEIKKRSRLPLFITIFFLLDALILSLPLLGRVPDPQAALRNALDFISRLYADSGTLLRDLLAASSVWPLLLAALLGSACCIMAAYACACYTFRGRKLLFAAAVLLQILPMLASYSSLEQLLRNLKLPISGVWLALGWALVYLLVALLLVRRFARMLPSLQKNREKFPGVRLFFYFALPRAPLYALLLVALATLGCWDDALAPFWYMRKLGAFSLAGYVWERSSGWGEFALAAGAFLAMLGLLLLILKLRSARPNSRLPRPSED